MEDCSLCEMHPGEADGLTWMQYEAAFQRPFDLVAEPDRAYAPLAPRAYESSLALVDWDAAGPVVPAQEVACFALVFADCGDGASYEVDVADAFIEGYRRAVAATCSPALRISS